MCGIVSAVSKRNITECLLEGLYRLEYRGYDSAGLAILGSGRDVTHLRCPGKVKNLVEKVRARSLIGNIGLAHTRWATHGQPSEINAHPHISGNIILVHNGIIENYEELRTQLSDHGYIFSSETDTEVIAHLLHRETEIAGSLHAAIKRVSPKLQGTYGIVAVDTHQPTVLVAARSGSPLVIGCGTGENFIASDQLALLQVTRRFIYLEEGDTAEVTLNRITITDKSGITVKRLEVESSTDYNAGGKGSYSHYMEREIYEQPIAIKRALANLTNCGEINFNGLESKANSLLSKVKHIQIVACGTSYNAAMVSRYWFEDLANIACDVEIASEFRYRTSVVRRNSLLITLSQSGETADTLAALRVTKERPYLGSLAICNIANSSLVRESDLALMTNAGTEIGVASTKAFTTQLTVLLMLVVKIGSLHGMSPTLASKVMLSLELIPDYVKEMLSDAKISEMKKIAGQLSKKSNALFLGRGIHYPIAMEGALKLKEISYIHAEAHAAGELKHGPLALVDYDIPVIILAPKNDLLCKIRSNIEEIHARGGILYIFTTQDTVFRSSSRMTTITLPHVDKIIAPIIYTVPLQLLAYYTSVIKGNDVDQPRNLAKSVTVE